MAHTQMRRLKLSRSSEYTNLRHVVPSLRRQRDVGKVEVVTEAARYIDHLHETLIERFVLCGIPDSLKDVLGTDDAKQLGSQHIMNLVASMAAAQRQQQEQRMHQQLTRQQQQQQQQHQQQLRRTGHHSHHLNQLQLHPNHGHNQQHRTNSRGGSNSNNSNSDQQDQSQLTSKVAPICERLQYISLSNRAVGHLNKETSAQKLRRRASAGATSRYCRVKSLSKPAPIIMTVCGRPRTATTTTTTTTGAISSTLPVARLPVAATTATTTATAALATSSANYDTKKRTGVTPVDAADRKQSISDDDLDRESCLAKR